MGKKEKKEKMKKEREKKKNKVKGRKEKKGGQHAQNLVARLQGGGKLKVEPDEKASAVSGIP
jgi:hypothetical protein